MSSLLNSKYAAESRVPQILVGSIVPFAIASLVVLARLYTRGFLTRNWGIDDCWILLSWILGIVLITLNCLLTKYGTGHHQLTISANSNQKTLLLAFATRLIYQLVLETTKVAIFTLFLRVFQDRKGRYIIYGLITFTVLYTTAVVFAGIFQCHPISYAWENYASRNCNSTLGPLWASGICNIFTDVLILLFVVPRILALKIHHRQKFALLAVVSLSVIAIISAIVRLVQVTRFSSGSDSTWNGSDITTWSAVEASTGLLCASAPTLRPLFRKMKGYLSSSAELAHSTPVYSRKKKHSEVMVQDRSGPWQNDEQWVELRVSTARESTTGLVYPLPTLQNDQKITVESHLDVSPGQSR